MRVLKYEQLFGLNEQWSVGVFDTALDSYVNMTIVGHGGFSPYQEGNTLTMKCLDIFGNIFIRNSPNGHFKYFTEQDDAE